MAELVGAEKVERVEVSTSKEMSRVPSKAARSEVLNAGAAACTDRLRAACAASLECLLALTSS
ncbi:hypothetical protein GOP47_0027741 [Adiantum capillus-veneris]|nr:hypothetical protein GOP47_0027741 [Adiantum capillus-veneris]